MEWWVLEERDVGECQFYRSNSMAFVLVLEREIICAGGEYDECFEAAFGDGPVLDWECGGMGCILGSDAQEVVVGVRGDALAGDENTTLRRYCQSRFDSMETMTDTW